MQASGNHEEILVISTECSADDLLFDTIVGALEDAVMEQEFTNLQDSFMREHCACFQEGEENKKEYMEVFCLYQNKVEKHLMQELSKRMSLFSMEIFNVLLETRADQIGQDLLETITSFTDFCTFKQIMLAFKRQIEQGPLVLSIRGKAHR